MPLLLLALLIASHGTALSDDSPATKRLKARNAEFEKDVIKITEDVYTAVGYTVSSNSMIIGDDGIIIVDPGQTQSGAKAIRAEFDKITDKPVKAIIYTHGHGDHTGGTKAFMDEDADIQIWARSNYGSEMRAAMSSGGRINRPADSQGFNTPPDKQISVGVAIPPYELPRSELMAGMRAPQPTHKFSEERKKLEIAGVKLELVAAPGETDDQLYVWLPDHKVVFSGDNFYKSWPNVYPLRGARRSIRDWANSVEKMLQEKPDFLVPGHTRPILSNVDEILTNYRDALRFVFDKTLEGARKYMTPDELVEYVKLPDHLAELDYLADYYGSVESTVRAIYSQALGWFDGDPMSLHRESPTEQSQRIAGLVGGKDKLIEKARQALEQDDPVWAAQLAQHAMRLMPDQSEPKLLLAEALDIMAERTLNTPVRNYSFDYAAQLRRQAEKDQHNNRKKCR